MKQHARISLFCCFLSAIVLFGMLGVLPGRVSAESEKVALHGTDGSVPEDGVIKHGANNYILATKFDVTGGKMVGFYLDDLNTDAACQGRLRIYRWNQDYPTTVAGEPLIQKLVKVTDSTFDKIESYPVPFDGAYEEGTYLAVLQSDGPMFLWNHPKAEGITCYRNGEVYQSGTFKVSYLRDASVTAHPSAKDMEKIDSFSAVLAIPACGEGVSESGTLTYQLYSYNTVAQKITVANGRFVGLFINDAIVEYDDVHVTVTLYRWQEDYDTTLSGTPVYSKEHLVLLPEEGTYSSPRMMFGRAYAEGDYLVVLEADGMCAIWAHGPRDGIFCYADDDFVEGTTLQIGYLADPDAELDERPVESSPDKATPSATPNNTPSPTAKLSGSPTSAASDNHSKEKEDSPMLFWVLAAVLLILVIIAILLLIWKKKKHSDQKG